MLRCTQYLHAAAVQYEGSGRLLHLDDGDDDHGLQRRHPVHEPDAFDVVDVLAQPLAAAVAGEQFAGLEVDGDDDRARSRAWSSAPLVMASSCLTAESENATWARRGP